MPYPNANPNGLETDNLDHATACCAYHPHIKCQVLFPKRISEIKPPRKPQPMAKSTDSLHEQNSKQERRAPQILQPQPSFIPQVHSPRTTSYNPFPCFLSSRNLREEHRITRQETIISQAKTTHCETGKSRWRRSAIPRMEPQGLMFKKLLFSFPFFCFWKTACVCCVLSLSLSRP